MHELIGRLEAAAEGSLDIDIAIAPAAGWRRYSDQKYEPSKWHDPEGVRRGLPKWSTSLDAKLPGENIESAVLQRPRPGYPPRWLALNVDGAEVTAGYGVTEPLARRIAALYAALPAARGE